MSGSGGGGTQTVNQSNLPDYARPYYEGLMDSALVESGRPYTQYEGPRLAGFNEFQTTGFNQVANLGNPMGMGLANMVGTQAAGLGMQQAQNANNWQAGQFGTNYQPQQFATDFQAGQFDSGYTPGQFDYNRFIDGTNPEDYMSPYMRNVADVTKREAIRDFGIQQTGRDAQAAKAGAFGGYRQGIENAEASRNLNQQLQDIDTRAQQSAYENAQQQFNADRSALSQTQQLRDAANQFGANIGLQGQQLGEQSRQFGANFLQQGQQLSDAAQQFLSNQQMQGQQFGEQSRQFGANLGQQATQGLAGLLGSLSGLGAQDQQMALERIGALTGVGDRLQQQQQSAYDTAYTDFLNQQDYTRNQLNFFNSLLRGVPTGVSSTTTQYAPGPNVFSQLGGAGLAALGAAKAS